MNNKWILGRTLPVCLAALVAACGQGIQVNETSPFASRPEVRAQDLIRDSFALKANDVMTSAKATDEESAIEKDRFSVGIAKTELEKEFLLQASLAVQPGLPTGSGLQSRVVAFRKRSGKLYLMEATQGHTVTDEVPVNLILAEFKILAEDQNMIYYDWTSGFSKIFYAGDWRAQDFTGGARYGSDHFTVSAPISFIEHAEFTENNQLVVRQISQLEVSGWSGVDSRTVEVKYYLEPYRPNPNFVPHRSRLKDFKRMGFFEVAPKLEDGRGVVYATKFDHSKPIVFAVSSNTPDEYKQAVKDGILYWNKAFGRDVVQAVEAPEGVFAPDYNYNVVQWINWDNAGFAYADAQMDPRNGEIRHAQSYMTSVFGYIGKIRAAKLRKRLGMDSGQGGEGESEHHGKDGHSHGQPHITLKGFEKERMCDLNYAEALADSFSKKDLDGMDVESIKKAAYDYVAEVVAHEVGHNLGLRHNFAGSLATNYALSERDELVKSYLENKKAPKGIVTSSSVMEYQVFAEAAISGDQITSTDKALEYDEKAILTLYDGKKYEPHELPAFCTDSHVRKYIDCARRDIGNSVVEYAVYSGQENRRMLAYLLAEAYVSAVSPPKGVDPVPVEEISIGLTSVANFAYAYRQLLVDQLTDDRQYLRIRRAFPYVGELNKKEVEEAERDYVVSEIERLGGLEKLLPSTPEDAAKNYYDQFISLMESPAYRSGIGPGGQPYEITDEQMEIIKATASSLFGQLQDKMVAAEAKYLKPSSRTAKLQDHALSDELAEIVAARAKEVVLATAGEKVSIINIPDKNNKDKKGAKIQTPVKLPVFTYSLETRQAMAGALKIGASAPDWAMIEKESLKKDYKKFLEAIFDGSPNRLKLPELPRPVRRWIMENSRIL